MIISKWSYVAMMTWCVISALIIGEVSSNDTMVIIDAILFGSFLICFEIRTLGEQLKQR